MYCSRRFIHGVFPPRRDSSCSDRPRGLAQEEGRIQGRVFIEGTRDPCRRRPSSGPIPPLFSPDGDRLTLAQALETVTDDDGRFRPDVDA